MKKIIILIIFVMILLAVNVNAKIDFNTTNDLSATDTGDWIGTTVIRALDYSNDGLIYLAGDSGLFGVYNVSANVSSDLRATDTDNWIGLSNAINTLSYDSQNKILYMAGQNGLFGKYNRTSNVTSNLSVKIGAGEINQHFRAIAHDPANNLVYLSGGSGNPNIVQFAVYNISSNITTNLSATDTSNWMSNLIILSLLYDSNTSNIFLGGQTGVFGFYNRTSNVTFDLRATDTDDWIGTTNVNALNYEENLNLIYLATDGTTSNNFGYYNKTSNVTFDLSATDTGNWMTSSTINALVYNSSQQLVYLGGVNGLFGFYNRTSNVTFDLRATDIGNWIDTTSIIAFAYDYSDQLVFIGLSGGKFGVYNPIIFVDTTFPIVNTTFNITSPKLNDIINFTGNITDETGLLFANITYNISGIITKINFSISGGTATVSNATKINVTRGNIINFTMYATDTSNNVKQNSTLITVANTVPIPNNVSISEIPITVFNSNLKGHCNYTDADNDITGGNQTYWYLNNSLVNEANNSFSFLGGNVTNNANIIFSCRYNDTFAWSNWINSSVATVGDVTAPVVINKSVSKTSYTSTENINITMVCTDSNTIDLTRVTTNKTDTHTNNTMARLSGDIFGITPQTFAVGNYNIPYFYCRDGSSNIVQEPSNLSFSVTGSGGGGSSSGGGGGGGGGGSIAPPIPQCKDNELLVSNKCVNSSLFNITLKIVGLTNIQPIVFYRTCGKFQEFRQMIRTNKVLKSAEFDKKQLNTNITIIGSDVLVIKKIRISKISERIDIGYLKLTDVTQQVARVFIRLRVINACNPLTYIFVVIPVIITIFRKKIAKFIKKK